MIYLNIIILCFSNVWSITASDNVEWCTCLHHHKWPGSKFTWLVISANTQSGNYATVILVWLSQYSGNDWQKQFLVFWSSVYCHAFLNFFTGIPFSNFGVARGIGIFKQWEWTYKVTWFWTPHGLWSTRNSLEQNFSNWN